jgi:predicted porin
MRKYLLLTIIAATTLTLDTSAQVSIGIGPRFGYGGFSSGVRRPYPQRRQKGQSLPKFDPIIHFSLGYGYPNLDATQLAGFYNYYRGTVTQTGPITGAIDYQYSQNASIGVLVTHGQVNASYYDYNNPSGPPVMNGSLDNWSVMLNMMNYIPTNGGKVIHIWNQNYTDGSGTKLGLVLDPNQFAYQVGLGANIKLSKNTGLFMEAGYGKYILHGGLSFKL